MHKDNCKILNIPISQPTLPDIEEFLSYLKEIFQRKAITNDYFVHTLEDKLKRYLRVREIIAVSSATSGLMILLRALNLKGEVLVPSFTFSATVNAILWNNLRPVFVDCDKNTFNINFDDLRKKITSRTSAVLGVHVFGNPLDMRLLEKIAYQHGLKVVIDAAHALGSKLGKRSVACFGDVTVFSLAPTKLVTSAEGGLIVTADRHLAQMLRVLRNYGNPADYNCRYIGLNARMSELHAGLGILSLRGLEGYIKARNRAVAIYKKHLKDLNGLRFQEVDKDNRSTYNYFAMVLDKKAAGISSKELKERLAAYGIETKRYFFPPVHRQYAFKDFYSGNSLQVTEELSENILCLPLYSHIKKETIVAICDIIKKICRRI